jgi:hypothetical protein
MIPAELRIGNFVFCDDKLTQVNINILISFCNGTIVLNPIPLDKEWLKKFGFYEFHYEDNKSEWFSDDVIEMEHKRTGSFIFKTFEITSVHQFQNVYLDLLADELSITEISDSP